MKEILKIFEVGHSYLIEEKKPARSFEILKSLIKSGMDAFCITRLHPKWVRKKYKVKAKNLWLSKKEFKYCVSPTDLGVLVSILEEFIKGTKNSVLLLEGLEYLIINNGFPIILRFIEDVNDAIMESSCRLILPIDPDTLDEKELALLERDMVVIKE